jgi:hypothetical protein
MALQPQDVTVVNEVPGSGQTVSTSFGIDVPAGWTAYRPPLSSPAKPIVATFVAPEGNRAITVDRLPGHYPKGTVAGYLDELERRLAVSVDDVVAQPVNPVGTAAAGATEGPHETSFRTVERGSDGANGELLRTILVYLLPTASDLWIVQVTVPSDQQNAGNTLFHEVIETFQPRS